jgi:hypothetical protein
VTLLSLHSEGEALGNIRKAGLANNLAARGELELLDVDAIYGLEAGLGTGVDPVLAIDTALDGEALSKSLGRKISGSEGIKQTKLTTPFAVLTLISSVRSYW